jgi:F-type H+-transporting ATPase subunit b
MNFSWWTFALQAANFLILVWLLQRFLFKPVKSIIARRKDEVAKALTEASAEKESAERLKQELAASRSAISAERQKIIDEARAMLSAERRKIIDEARAEAEKVHDQALKRLEDERIDAAQKLYERTVELATALAERMLREIAVSSVEQPFLGRVIDYLDRMPPEERAKLLPRNGTTNVLLTTAHPLDEGAQSVWREQLVKRFGAGIGVTFNTDPTLIAGTVLTFPHAILNFNWRDSLALALKELHGNEHPR